METKQKILIAEDDINLGKVIGSYLQAKGFEVTLCENGSQALDEFQKDDFSLCLLDIMMPVKNGYVLSTEIRDRDKKIPIVFMSVKSLEEDVLKGFQLDIDDYIIKPFSIEELLMRIQAILRRTCNVDDEVKVFQIGKILFDSDTQLLVYRKNKQVRLTSKENALLYVLCAKMGMIVNRSYILKKVWENNDHYNARSIDVYINRLRKYLRHDSNISILNVHGIGFKLIVEK
ncbi:MAG: response regulator transcription factor [Bacteroidales bacterium]|jgi:DNA-binding response OmpR family regulator|nr:response regulator transcription factor [Bacteroidales bacterium]MDD2687854.1 response regulator transcription factor [Bacteroidales bacterium]MDD3330755.1 response regulator transcription factor [Bacteroidales bacterium]MDD3691665.1 response regulator transcription factor [Bacteroidales bacterium]MDD4045092.1 response regulator transcription factor [Bacteroidales bacterium]